MFHPLVLAGLVLVIILGSVFLFRRRPGERAPNEPPAADRVALRAIAVAAACARAHVEAAAVTERKLPLEEAERHRTALDAWVRREQLSEQLSETEQAWIEAPVGRLDEDDLLDASWTAEGLAILLWALRATPELPPDGVEVEPGALLERVPAVGSDVTEFVGRAALRPRDEIEAAAFRAYERYDDTNRDQFGAAVATRALSIAIERRRAFRWLSGDSPTW